MDNKKLKVKDLVSIGVFAVIYFALMFGIGMMGMIPILFLIYPTVLAIVAGTVVMLFMTKVQKPWALFIFGMDITTCDVCSWSYLRSCGFITYSNDNSRVN